MGDGLALLLGQGTQANLDKMSQFESYLRV